MSTITVKHIIIPLAGSAAELRETATYWAFDNGFSVDEALPRRIRLTRRRAKLAFLYSFNILDYPLQILIKQEPNAGAVEVQLDADLTGTLVWLFKQDLWKLDNLGRDLSNAIAALGFTGATSSHEDATRGQPTSQAADKSSLAQLLAELGFPDQPASWREVETRYRDLVRQYHPDRYASQNLPPEMIDAASQRFKRIVVAYEQLKELRGTAFM